MTHHITDEQIAKLHDSMFPAPYDGHANVIRFARAVLALAAPAPAVPSGWKLVPVEPTQEMLAAVSWPECARTDWAHMLTAAPTSPAQPAAPEDVARDAERYRWLRDNHESCWAICEWQDDPDGLGYYRDARAPEVVDAAIDAARAAEKGGE